ncbi:MAG: uroporphyrinogen decarboxylase family protein [Kiritimatiellae bacterium]|jgi:MtaA/CmuA family methyltransferase|nr:uroporphyrinogen decarboxylase family protein [Kiritimatiellia bacterium]
MTGKEILFKALKNEVTPRPAWVPFVGVHGAHLIGVKAEEFLKSEELMFKGLTTAAERYQADGIPVMFDLQLEAEVLGCDLIWSDDNPPSVTSHPLEGGGSLAQLPAFDLNDGRLPSAFSLTRKLKDEIGDKVGIYGLICGPFTLAMHLMGQDLFMQMFDHPDYVKAVVSYCASVGTQMSKAYIDAGADIIAVVDPMTSQISSEHFSEFVSPYLNLIFDSVREQECFSSLFVCGDATRNMGEMSKTSCDNMSIDENISLGSLRDISRTSGKSFGGNLKLTSALLFGEQDDARLDAIRCIDVAGGAGFILAPGCDLPFATPPENLEAVAEMAHDRYKREVSKRTIIVKDMEHFACDLPDEYSTQPNVIVDIVTLDSASCAPCSYMVGAVNKASTSLSKPVQVKEHRISSREGLAAMKKLGVQNIPTICIDGEIAFASIIPDQKSLIKCIEESIAKKG